jgi:hypothetical protein
MIRSYDIGPREGRGGSYIGLVRYDAHLGYDLDNTVGAWKDQVR